MEKQLFFLLLIFVKYFIDKQFYFQGNYLAEHCVEAQSIFTSAKIISVPWDVYKGNITILFLLKNENLTGSENELTSCLFSKNPG